jgi:beta-fructofuranosidase
VACGIATAAEPRDRVLEQAQAHWRLGADNHDSRHPLAPVGRVTPGRDATGTGAISGSKTAVLEAAYFDAGRGLNLQGDACTVYLRARDPGGTWGTALFAKRGHHEIINFNLYSSGDLFGFELHGERGLGQVTFPRSAIDPTAWHDFVGVYDGRTIELICDGKVMASRPWAGGRLTENEEPLLVGAETERGRVVRPFTGELEEAALWSRALARGELAALSRKQTIEELPAERPEAVSPIHFRPPTGNAGDVIPYFAAGRYHLFYLNESKWAHVVSDDLLHWTPLPPAIGPSPEAGSPDGEACWTGSIVEHEGVYHLFYTGKNLADPAGDQKVMVATSRDLIAWEKQPARTFYADGTIYWSSPVNGPADARPYHHQAFRDPDVFWHEPRREWWMLLHALTVTDLVPCLGLYASPDLVHWEPREPIATYPALDASLDCPHAAPVQDRWFVLAADANYTSAERPEGPYPPRMQTYDYGDLFVPKSLSDGRRRLIWGWVRDLEGRRDAGKELWGGTISMAKEIYPDAAGALCCRPAAEVVNAFQRVAVDLATRPPLLAARGAAGHDGSSLVCADGSCELEVPPDYLLECSVELEPATEFALVFRDQGERPGGYELAVSAATRTVTISREGRRFGGPIDLDVAAPVKIQAFVQGSILECFVNERWAFTCRAYDFAAGRLGIRADGGRAAIGTLTVRTLGP